MPPLTPRPEPPSVLLLGIASSLSPFGVTIAVPILAGITTTFAASAGAAQFVISAYLLGLALAQPFNGFLCDRLGRRPVLLGGFGVFVAASVAAAYATQLELLIACRFLQAVGVSVGTVASRAVVRDTRDAAGAAEALAYIAAAMGFAPVVAPILGGWLGASWGYQTVFWITALMGVVTLAAIYLLLPETLHADSARPRWSQWMRNYRALFTSGPFIGYTLVFGFIQGCFFAFLAIGATLFEQRFGIGARQFGLWWGLMAISYVLGAVASGRLTRRIGPERVMRYSVLAALAAGWLAVAWVSLRGVTVPGVLVPMGLLMLIAGSVTPGALAGAVNLFPRMAGTASGLSSAAGIVIGGLFTVIAGYSYDGDYRDITYLIAGCATLTAASWYLVHRHPTATGEPQTPAANRPREP